MFLFRGKRKITPVVTIHDSVRNTKFKSLNHTYKIYTFLMNLAFMYPHPKTDKKRALAISSMSLAVLPGILLILNDMYFCLQNADMQDFARHMIVVIAVSFCALKTFLTLIHGKQLREVFDSISEDYRRYNDLSEDYHETIDRNIKKSKFIESSWTTITCCTGIGFPGAALLLTVYSLFSESPRRFMVHESHTWIIPEETIYSSPFYEIYFVYQTFMVAFVVVVFTGFDGMFSVCIFHMSLKIKIISIKVMRLLEDPTDLPKIKKIIAEIVRDQCEVYDFIGKLMKCYENWLAMMFTLSVIQIGMALTQIISNEQGSGGSSIVFFLFMGANVAHIFFPCYLCSDVTFTASLHSDVIYSIAWEDVPDPGFRRSILFMLCQAQRPVSITALKLITFNMETFVSVLQTGYSMFTLLKG